MDDPAAPAPARALESLTSKSRPCRESREEEEETQVKGTCGRTDNGNLPGSLVPSFDLAKPQKGGRNGHTIDREPHSGDRGML